VAASSPAGWNDGSGENTAAGGLPRGSSVLPALQAWRSLIAPTPRFKTLSSPLLFPRPS
jgi:hypothetical protein